MNELFNVNNKVIYDINTTILYTSSFNYTDDAIYYLNNNCIVITKDRGMDTFKISNDIFELFHEEKLIHKKDLTKIDELKLKILASLNTNKTVFVFFDVLTYLDKDFKERLIRYLILNKKRIINYTTDIEETLLLDYLVVLHENKIIMEGKKELVLQEEKILKKLGFNLPFIVELSNGLKYYGVIDKVYFNNEELVNVLWK
ncbi:MAG TPA: hypothetical protein IAB49_02825 [Candidatus Caccenecus avistercoris]|nr:hypothetical protein [Candidatus Caccenecus avistercoris]